jgi:hypothetical protein
MRMPSFSRELEDWVEYLLETEQTVDDAIERTTSEAVASWLKENRGEIEAEMKGSATATFVTQGEIISDPEKEFGEPAKGTKI